MSEMLERAAEKAFWAHVAATNPETLGTWEMVRDVHKETFRKVAAAVLDALMEPDETMVEAAIAPYRHGNTAQFNDIMRETVRGYFRAMITAAKETK